MRVYSYSRISRFCFCNLDLDPVTLTYELDLGILKMSLRTKNEVSKGQGFRKLQHEQTDTQTDATKTITTSHSWMVRE